MARGHGYGTGARVWHGIARMARDLAHSLHMHQGANFDHLKLTPAKLGLNFELPSDIYRYCKLSIRNIMHKSTNQDMKILMKLTRNNNIMVDRFINDTNPKKALKDSINNSTIDHMEMLKESNTIMKFMKENCTSTSLNIWKKLHQDLPRNIFIFIRRALIFGLPNKTNLLRWKKVDNDTCDLCAKKQTQLHMLSNCLTAVKDGRYMWRHNSILYTM